MFAFGSKSDAILTCLAPIFSSGNNYSTLLTDITNMLCNQLVIPHGNTENNRMDFIFHQPVQSFDLTNNAALFSTSRVRLENIGG